MGTGACCISLAMEDRFWDHIKMESENQLHDGVLSLPHMGHDTCAPPHITCIYDNSTSLNKNSQSIESGQQMAQMLGLIERDFQTTVPIK